MYTSQRRYGLWINNFCRGGRDAGQRPEDMPFRRFPFYNISHCYERGAWLLLEGSKVQTVEKGCSIFLAPGAAHKYQAFEGDLYVEDAISFAGPVADALLDSGVFRTGIMKLGEARRLLPIIELAIENTEDSQLKASLAIQNLLVETYFSNKKEPGSKGVHRLDQLMAEIRSDAGKWWSVESMAEYCNLSAIQFNRLFKARTGMTPKSYIDSFKMQMAVEMLSAPSLPIGEIASRLGYVDQYHFSRRFKQLKGRSPQACRKLLHGLPVA